MISPGSAELLKADGVTPGYSVSSDDVVILFSATESTLRFGGVDREADRLREEDAARHATRRGAPPDQLLTLSPVNVPTAGAAQYGSKVKQGIALAAVLFGLSLAVVFSVEGWSRKRRRAREPAAVPGPSDFGTISYTMPSEQGVA